MDKKEFALKQHEEWKGKIEAISRANIETPEELSVAYTPGVAEPCLKISEDVDLSHKYTRRGNMVVLLQTVPQYLVLRYWTGGWYAGYGRKMCLI